MENNQEELNKKEEAKKIQGILKGLGDEVSLGHCYELMARMAGHTSWKQAKKESRTCPACDSPMSEHSSISRKDNTTEICSDCGTKEALEQFLKHKKIEKEVDLSGIDLSDINGRAEWMLRFFIEGQRDNKETYYYLGDHPKKQIAQAIVRACHNEMLPDDWKYRFIREALVHISDVTDGNYEEIAMEGDIYTHDLLKWLSSNLTRTEYMDTVSKEYGPYEFFDQHLRTAQMSEKLEVLNTLLHILSKESTYQDMKK